MPSAVNSINGTVHKQFANSTIPTESWIQPFTIRTTRQVGQPEQREFRHLDLIAVEKETRMKTEKANHVSCPDSDLGGATVTVQAQILTF